MAASPAPPKSAPTQTWLDGIQHNPFFQALAVFAVFVTFLALLIQLYEFLTPPKYRLGHFRWLGRAVAIIFYPILSMMTPLTPLVRWLALPMTRLQRFLSGRVPVVVALFAIAGITWYLVIPRAYPNIYNSTATAISELILAYIVLPYYVFWWISRVPIPTNSEPKALSPVGNKMQIIAWKGWEDERLYSQPDALPISKELLNFLLYVRGFGSIPKLYSSTGVAYDLLISDVEFLAQYHRAGRLECCREVLHSSPPIEFAGFVEKIRQSDGTRPNFLMGVPLKCGFQEILLHNNLYDALFPNVDAHPSYSDFRIEAILERDPTCRVGIWNSYLPALGTLISLQRQPGFDLETVWCAPESEVNEVLGAIKRLDPHRIVLLDTVEQIYENAVEDTLVVVYGAGSWAFPDPNKVQNFELRPLVPREGTFVWLECATILSDAKEKDRSRAISLIRHWLRKDVQEQLLYGGVVRALPVTREALQHARQHNQESPLVRIMDQLVNQKFEARQNVKLVPRRIPRSRMNGSSHFTPDEKLRLSWEMAWSEFERWHKEQTRT